MFRGNRTPDDLTPIDSTDNNEQIAVKSAWNLNRYGTSWPEILKAVEQAKKDEFVDDSLEYLFNQDNNYYGEDNFNDYNRRDLMYRGFLVPSDEGDYYLNGTESWPYSERSYFNYLESIADHPLDNRTDKEHPINERAKAYQYWKKLKYGDDER
ncbi:hypothetical protein [Pseudobutyrivibrio sp.]|jgi:hypothetical protein|uniref:hypothetical protein n=1 Tax=Pseudobutyrivibrio sp. TaxID=2014367 RepID=UPI0025E28FCA|nr:hypothetical protein [Pseudobutyrivibrio sp.]